MAESSIKERLKLYIKEKGLSQGKFEKKAGLSNGFVNNISKGIGSEKLQSIFCNFPDLNQDWLLTGEGDMLKPCQVVGDISNSNVSGVNVSGKEIYISSLDAYNTLLQIVEKNQKSVEVFQSQIDRLITMLEKKL